MALELNISEAGIELVVNPIVKGFRPEFLEENILILFDVAISGVISIAFAYDTVAPPEELGFYLNFPWSDRDIPITKEMLNKYEAAIKSADNPLVMLAILHAICMAYTLEEISFVRTGPMDIDIQLKYDNGDVRKFAASHWEELLPFLAL